MIHKPLELTLVTNNGSVMTAGGSTKLAKGQLGIVDKNGTPTKDGLPVVNSFTGKSSENMFQLRLGVHNIGTSAQGRTNKSYESRPFTLKEVVKITATAPTKLGGDVDEWWIGYDGIDDSTAITMKNGQTEKFDITLSGTGVAFANYPEGKVNISFYITAPNEGPFTMEQVITEAVERLKETTLAGGIKVTDFIEVTPINSKNPVSVTGTDYTLYTLTVPNGGNTNEQADVYAQFPTLDIKFQGSVDNKATYVVASTEAPGVYKIKTTDITVDCDKYESADTSEVEVDWVAGGTCTAVSKTFNLVLADTKCGEDRLTELQEAYDGLHTIVKGESKNCQTTYTTTVLTNFVCEECSPIIRDLYTADAPDPFDFIDWVEAPKVFDGEALMGIRLKGKTTKFAGGEEFRDDIPFVYDFIRINVTGGYPITIAENIVEGVNGTFNVKNISIGTRPSGLGMDYMDKEERSRVYFSGDQRFCNNLYGNRVLGYESLLKPLSQYVMYSIYLETSKYAQSNSLKHQENFKYDILVEVGKHTAVETLVNALATGAGLPTVSAY